MKITDFVGIHLSYLGKCIEGYTPFLIAAEYVDPVVAKDGRTYDREPFETWYRLHKSSPVTGLPMDSGTWRNQFVSTRIAAWASGKSANRATTIPAKRKSNALDDTVWKLRLCYGVDSWIVELSPDSSLSFLTELAFRCLNTRVPTSMAHIRLYHGSTRLSYDSARLTSTAIKDGDPLRVETTNTGPQPNVGIYSSVSMCLIKLYRGHYNLARTCFWVPKDTDASLLSLLIRYWHWSESDLVAEAVSSSEIEVWTPITKSEDFLEKYWCLKTSSSLKDVIRDYAVEGWLENGPMFEKPTFQQGTNCID
jgi:hypothetical protein